MPIDVQWVDLLALQVQEQKDYARQYDERYRGERIVRLVADEYREVYGTAVDGVLRVLPPRTGAAAIGIDALVDRLLIEGFGVAPSRSQAGAAFADDLVAAAQAFWDDNDLDAMHPTAHREAFIAGRSFGLVWPGVDGRAVASIESADQMAVHRLPAPPYDIDVVLKLETDEWTAQRRAFLWIDRRRSTFAYDTSRPAKYTLADGTEHVSNWRLIDGSEVPSVLGRPPVVEFAQWTRLQGAPTSAIEPVASLVDEADLCEALKVFAGHFGAVPNRYATGLPIPRDPRDPTGQTPLLGPDGKPVLGFNARADHMWTSTNKDTKFGQFTPATLDGFVAWSKDTTNKIRAKTAVPEFYYGTEVAGHMTGEVLKVAESPMIRRVLSVRKPLTQSWRRFLSYGLAIDVPALRARDRTVLPRWTNPETRIEAMLTDAFGKQVAAGVPLKIAMRETLGWSPELVQEALDLVSSGGGSIVEQLSGLFGPKPNVAA